MCIHSLPFLFIEGKEGNVLLNDALNTFYLRLYGGNIVNNHSDSERRNPLPLRHGLLFPISSKESFIYTIPQLGEQHWLKREIAQWVHHEGSI